MVNTTISNGATALLESTSHIPIAQLTPLLTASSSRSVKAIVTLTWPYSSATGSVAFLLAEPDFRLRRTRGQVRVQFSGSSAKFVARSGIASGDEVILCLDGVEWIQDETPFATPGRGVEFELRFTERLLLQFRQEESQEVNLIDINHPAPEPEAPSEIRISSPGLAASAPVNSTSIDRATTNGEEWSSPAFIKRARTSYGSLFDKDYDPFAEDDGTIRGRGRKRTRLSSTWRYESRSPSPEIDVESPQNTSPEPVTQSTPIMTDEGCQTVGLDVGDVAEVLADFSRQATNMGIASYAEVNGTTISEYQAQFQPLAETSELGDKLTEPPPIHTKLGDQPTELQMIQTHPGSGIAEPSAQEARQAPSSPRLHPLSSDALPIVSPLITNRFGAFLGMVPPHGVFEQAPSFSEDFTIPSEEQATVVAEEEREDLYGASPPGSRGQSHVDEHHGFRDSAVGIGGLQDPLSMEGQFLSEDLYGHWQSTTAQLTQAVSPPYKAVEDIQEDDERMHFQVEEHEDEGNIQHVGLQILETAGPRHQRYPEFDDGPHGQPAGTSWGPQSRATAYPDLPEPNGEVENVHVIHDSLRPSLHAMSRSQSVQSAVVDLTESSGEGEAEENEEAEEEAVSEGSIDEEVYDGSEGELIDEEGDIIQEGYVGHQYLRQDNTLAAEDGVSSSSQDDEAIYEEEFEDEFEDEETYEKYPPDFEEDQEGSFNEEDERSYDEEDMEDEAPDRPTIHQEPVVIDLLSSDDEDGPEIAATSRSLPLAELITSPRHGIKTTSPHSSEDGPSELDEDMEQEEVIASANNMHPAFRTQASTRLAREPSSDEVKETDKQVALAEGDESSIDARDDDNRMEAAVLDDNSEDDGRTDIHPETEMAGSEVFPEDGKPVDLPEEDEEANEELEPVTPTEAVPEGSHEVLEVEEDTVLPEPEDRGMSTKHEEPSASDRPSEPSGGNLLRQEPSLFAMVFNLDGASDESPAISYPVLPKDESMTSHITAPALEEPTQGAVLDDDQDDRQINDQLPTPDDTQLSQARAFMDSSFSSATVLPLSTGLLQSTLNEIVTDLALKTASQPMAEANDDSVDDTMANAGNGVTGAETTNERAKTTAEEDDIERARNGDVPQVIVDGHNTRSHARQQSGNVEPVNHEEAEKAGEIAHASPRRSHRRVKSSGSVAETQLPKQPSTPSRSTIKANGSELGSVQTDRSLPIILDDQAMPNGHDASVEVALSALNSPNKQQYDLRKPPVADLKLRLSRALRTELGEFTALKVLRYHLNQKLDVLGVATTTHPEPQRAKGGPRHYQVTFNITDPSVAPSGVTEVQVYRPYKDALPIINVGDGILLRNFQVISVKNRGFALRSDQNAASSWAVFKNGQEEPEMRGPPVEYGDIETKHMIALKMWYETLDGTALGKINRANADKGTTGVGKGIGKVF